MLQSILEKGPVYLIGQFIGIVALTIAICSFQQRSQKKIATFQFLSSIFFATHFYLLGAYVGCLLNAVSIFRAYVFKNKDKKWARNPLWLAVFIAIFTFAGIATIDGDLNLSTWNIEFGSADFFIGLLPVISTIISTVGFWVDDPKKVRLLYIPAAPCWLIYNFYHGSIGGVCTELFALGSVVVGLLRFDIKKKKD